MQVQPTATLDITREKKRTLAQIAEKERRTAIIKERLARELKHPAPATSNHHHP